MCVSVCKCDVCSFFNYCINMDFESANKRFIYLNANLLCPQQFGFRSAHSTELAALKLVNNIISRLNDHKAIQHLYIDL